MVASAGRLGSSWKVMMLMFILATSLSDVAGYSVSLGGNTFANNFASTSAQLHLGENTIKKPSGQPRRMSHEQSSEVATGGKEFQEMSDDQGVPDLDIELCSISQLGVTQDIVSRLPDGTPIFHVTIVNNCVTCSLEDIRIACGDWTSAILVNPAVFRKEGYNDCIVNNGSPLASLSMLFFEYSSTISYPMIGSSGQGCCCN